MKIANQVGRLFLVLLSFGCAAPQKAASNDPQTSCYALVTPLADGCAITFGQTRKRASAVGVATEFGDGAQELRCGEAAALAGCNSRIICDCAMDVRVADGGR